MGLALPSSFDLRSPTGLVRKGFLAEPRTSLPTGLAPLDAILPDGGLPSGRITEITGRAASGKLSLALAIATLALERGDPVALLDASATVRPAVWTAPALEHLLVVRGGGARTALGAADALLRTAAFPLLILDLPGRAQVPTAAFLRLTRETRAAGSTLLVLSEWLPWRTTGLASLVCLRLEVRPLLAARIAVSLSKSKLGNPEARAVIDLAAALAAGNDGAAGSEDAAASASRWW